MTDKNWSAFSITCSVGGTLVCYLWRDFLPEFLEQLKEVEIPNTWFLRQLCEMTDGECMG